MNWELWIIVRQIAYFYCQLATEIIVSHLTCLIDTRLRFLCVSVVRCRYKTCKGPNPGPGSPTNCLQIKLTNPETGGYCDVRQEAEEESCAVPKKGSECNRVYDACHCVHVTTHNVQQLLVHKINEHRQGNGSTYAALCLHGYCLELECFILQSLCQVLTSLMFVQW